MPNHTPRQSSSVSNLPLIAAVGFAGLGILAVAGVIVYHKLTPRGEPEVVASVPAANGAVAEQKQPDGKTPAPSESPTAPSAKSAARPAAARTAPTRKADPARVKSADDQIWREEVAEDIKAARSFMQQVKEPVQAPGMTMVEYKRALTVVNSFKQRYPVEGPIPIYRLLLNADLSQASSVMPETSRVLRREAFTQIARLDRPGMERQVMALTPNHPEVRLLLDNELYTKLHATLPWQERKTQYERFQMLTGVKGAWSLLQPFDDLTGPDMAAAIAAAEKLKTSGLRALTSDERTDLLAGGAVDAVEDALVRSR